MTELHQNANINQTPKNKGFNPIHQHFINSDWELTKNEDTKLIYSNKNNPYDEFLISVEMDHIIISAPMPNSNMAYRSSVKTYWDASEYLQSHLENYIKNIKKPSALPKNKGYDSD